MLSLLSHLNKLSTNYTPLPMKTSCAKSTDVDGICPPQLEQGPVYTSVSKDESVMAPVPVATYNPTTSSTIKQDQVLRDLVTGSIMTPPNPTANTILQLTQLQKQSIRVKFHRIPSLGS